MSLPHIGLFRPWLIVPAISHNRQYGTGRNAWFLRSDPTACWEWIEVITAVSQTGERLSGLMLPKHILLRCGARRRGSGLLIEVPSV